jgi:two-component system sensor histidine kinase PilS (NtrC family)
MDSFELQKLNRRFETTLLYHSIVIFLIGCLLSFSIRSIVFEGSVGQPHEVLFFLGILGLFSGLIALSDRFHETAVMFLFLADLVALWVLTRATGGSASPFHFTFPLVSLAGAAVFNQRQAFIILFFTVLFQVISIGFLPSAATSIFATLGTTSLGLYLVRTLTKSDKALKASELSRKRLENLQRAILTHIPSGLISVNRDRQVILCNNVGLRILGYSEQDLLLRSVDELFEGLSLDDDLLMGVSSVTKNGEGRSGVKKGDDRPLIEYRTSNGENLKLGYSVAPLSDTETGQSLGALVVFQDLTEIIKLEESLRLTEKLAAVGKLAAGIAHEIRNPLAGISGSAQLLMGHPQLSEEDNKLLAIIQKETRRLDTLITEFLDYVRPPQPKIEPVDIFSIAKHVVESLAVNAKWKSLNCGVQIAQVPDLSVKILGDSNKITQVLMNLILNAGQASASLVKVTWKSSSQTLEVSDNGKGISQENQKRLFEPFFTTKETGTGLGLATSYRALESMGAQIHVDSPNPQLRDSPTQGTLFTISFRKVEK